MEKQRRVKSSHFPSCFISTYSQALYVKIVSNYFVIFLVPFLSSLHCQKTLYLVFDCCSSVGLILPFFVCVFYVVAEVEPYSGLPQGSEFSSPPSSLFKFCAAFFRCDSFQVLRLLVLFELEVLDGFLSERKLAEDVEGDFVGPLHLWFLLSDFVFVDCLLSLRASLSSLSTSNCSSSLRAF